MTGYPYFTVLLDLLEAEGAPRLSKRDLAKELLTILGATGIRLRGPGSAIWAELVQEKEPHRRNAKTLRSIARSADPLRSIGRADSCLRYRILWHLEGWWSRQRQRSKLRHAPEDLIEVAWDRLGPKGDPLQKQLQQEVRCKIRSLARYEEGMIKPGAPFKGDQEAALMHLADLFIRLTGKDCHTLGLPHSEGSPFIRFAHHALAPHFASTEVSPAALSQRYYRAIERRSGS